MQSTIEDDISSLRPETLFEPKPPSKREQIGYSLESNGYQSSNQQAFGSAANSTLKGTFPLVTTTVSNISNSSNNQLFHSFGNTKTPQTF